MTAKIRHQSGTSSRDVKPNPDSSSTSSRHRMFNYRNGCKLHTFSREEAPWPFSFNREVLEQCALDHALILKARDTQTFTDFKGNPPKRCLDLGTALGDWVVDTAQRFPETTFVGFDLVDIQIPLKFLEPSLAGRIQWVHGNFLKPLPFPDNEFDYIHLEGIALGVPEDKWHTMFGELNRVLRPGGFIELIQQDALFPVLPRWFTDPLHGYLEERVPNLPGRSRQSFLPSPTSRKVPHAHALLEELFYSVFESRFINPTPTSILPDFFTTTFRHVVSPPILRFPMPPIAPLPPRATEAVPACLAAQETTSDPLEPAAAFIPGPSTSLSTDSDSASTSTLVDADSVLTSATSLTRTLSRISENSTESDPALVQLHRTLSTSSSARSPIDEPSMKRRSVAVLTPTETTRIGDESSSGLFRMERLQSLPNDALFMHLYQAVRMVLSVKEAMWDELLKRVDANDRSLRLHGWEDADCDERASRDRFDALVDRYYGDMQVRMSLWHSLVKAGWPYPRRELLSPGECAEEEKLRQAILEARRNATEQEFAIPTRSIRLLLGVKCT